MSCHTYPTHCWSSPELSRLGSRRTYSLWMSHTLPVGALRIRYGVSYIRFNSTKPCLSHIPPQTGFSAGPFLFESALSPVLLHPKNLCKVGDIGLVYSTSYGAESEAGLCKNNLRSLLTRSSSGELSTEACATLDFASNRNYNSCECRLETGPT